LCLGVGKFSHPLKTVFKRWPSKIGSLNVSKIIKCIGYLWFTPVILAVFEAEMRNIIVWGQL
jgi:hypothetical protein